MAGRRIINEYVQEFTPEEVAEDLLSLANDGEARKQQKSDLSELHGSVFGDLAKNASLALGKKYLTP